MDKMSASASVLLFILVGLAQADNCDKDHWMPPGTEINQNPNCVEYDDSLIPDCGVFIVDDVTSYYHIHEYNCSRFWECSPEGPCLFECAPCAEDNPQCLGEEALSFDCQYQAPVGPVCDWPNVVQCVYSSPAPTTTTSTTTPDPGCITDEDCLDNEWCDTSGFPGICRIGCRDDDGCTATSCSTCEDHVCHDPECCVDNDCPGSSCSTCENNMCHDPECCVDNDCPGSVCSTCEDNVCHDPECCVDEDCPDVTDLVCSVCSNDILTCSRPECCVDEDCEEEFVCENQLCVPEGECDAERPCEGANEVCNDLYDNCEWCDIGAKECKPGCADDANCLQKDPNKPVVCKDNHRCQEIGVPGVVNITVRTRTCSGCAGSSDPQDTVEGGVAVFLIGDFGTECRSNGLDNLEKVDYDDYGMIAFFDGAPDDDGDDDGMGGCKGADLNFGLNGGSATWTGPGTWTANSPDSVCIKFYDPVGNKPTCCCELSTPTLSQDQTSDLVNCECKL